MPDYQAKSGMVGRYIIYVRQKRESGRSCSRFAPRLLSDLTTHRRDKFAFSHDLLDLAAPKRSSRHLFPQQVPRGEVDETELFRQLLALRPLSTSRSACSAAPQRIILDYILSMASV